jgi:hypothetical protein
MNEELRLKILEQVKDAGDWKMEFVPEAIIQDAQVSAGQARYVEAVNDCIKIAEESSARFLVPKLEELKAKILEGII